MTPPDGAALDATTAPRPTLNVGDAEAIAQLRGVLARARFFEDDIRKAIQIAGRDASLPMRELHVVDQKLPREGVLPALIRFFICSFPAKPEELEPLLRPLTLDRLQSLGLIRLGPEGAAPRVRLLSIREFFVVSDLIADVNAEPPPDFVLGVNVSSVALATITTRRPARRALDLGTGCGVLSLLAASHCEKIVATDLNPRAVNFAEFNCALNGVTNVECRQGSLFEPVEGEKFDLFFANPPYVVSPDTDFQYRDSGRPLDSFCRTLVKQLPAHLNEGATAAILCDWVLRGEEDWSVPVREWVKDSACDALVFRSSADTPLGYAAMWNRPLATSQPRVFRDAIDRWTGHFRQSGISAIVSGGLILRRRSGRENWIDTIDLPAQRAANGGEHLDRMIESRDWLQRPDVDAVLLRTVFQPAPDLWLDQTMRPREGRLAPDHFSGGLAGGLQLRAGFDPVLARLAFHLDGRRRLEEIEGILREETGLPAGELREKVLTMAKELYTTGFILRVTGA